MLLKINDFVNGEEKHLSVYLPEHRLLDTFLQLSVRLRFVVLHEKDFACPLYLWAFLFEAAFCVHVDGLIMVEKKNSLVWSLEQLLISRYKFNFWQKDNWIFLTQKKVNSYLQENHFRKLPNMKEVFVALKDFFELKPASVFALEVVKGHHSIYKQLNEAGFRTLVVRLSKEPRAREK